MKSLLLKLILSGHLAIMLGPSADFITTRRAIGVGAVEGASPVTSAIGQAIAIGGITTAFEIATHYADKQGLHKMAGTVRWSWGLTGVMLARHNEHVYKEQLIINRNNCLTCASYAKLLGKEK